jgi:hypothetical protein
VALSTPQMAFLEQHGIPLSRVFDATGMSRGVYQAAMSQLEMVVASGVSPCKVARHTLRTRAGHCAQCNTHALAFLLRHDEPGEVYVAYSTKASLVKIGTSWSAYERMANLNSYGYGGVSDWRVEFREACAKAGRVEFGAHRRLTEHRVTRTYVKTGSNVVCQELFQCSVKIATSAVREAAEECKNRITSEELR